MNGRFVLVLHSHLPYVLGKGRWPFGEEWLHEVVLETYLPLLEGLECLAHDDIPAPIAIGLTPILMEQLKSPDFVTKFRTWTDAKRAALEEDVSRLPDTLEVRELNMFYRDELERRRSQFDALGGDVVGAFASLQERGRLEVITSCATHGYMPLFGNDESRRLQIRTGAAAYQHWMGRRPNGFWLPECGYIPGVERLLAERRDCATSSRMQPRSIRALDRSTTTGTFLLQRAPRLHGNRGTSAQASQSFCATPRRASGSGHVISAILVTASTVSSTSGATAHGGR